MAAAVAVLAASTVLAGCAGDRGYPVRVEFTKGISLYEASDVRVLGLPAGEIERVRVEDRTVVVDLRIDHDVVLPADVRATIVPLSLIGERYVQLAPAWAPGRPRLAAGATIPLERTSVPVEPDEALEAFKELLDRLDPDATGRLVRNLADDLEGQGQPLNDALRGLGTVAQAFGERDDELGAIVDGLDRLTAGLATRERQLGAVLDDFASAATLLAAERDAVERLVRALATLSTDALGLVAEHRDRLDRDITVLSRTLRSVGVHLDAVLALVDSAPLTVAGPGLDGTRGLRAAYDPHFHHIDLRNVTTPETAQLFDALGLPGVEPCVPGEVTCGPPRQSSRPPGTAQPAEASGVGTAQPARVRAPAPSAADRPGVVRRLARIARALAEVVA